MTIASGTRRLSPCPAEGLGARRSQAREAQKATRITGGRRDEFRQAPGFWASDISELCVCVPWRGSARSGDRAKRGRNRRVRRGVKCRRAASRESRLRLEGTMPRKTRPQEDGGEKKEEGEEMGRSCEDRCDAKQRLTMPVATSRKPVVANGGIKVTDG
jgi:hypothetical protein